MPRCRRCLRTLRSHTSVIAGLGRVCARKELHRDGDDQENVRSHYQLTVEPARLYLVDLDDGFRSLTNDAPGVIVDLANRGLLVGRRVFYQDSAGRWDEIVHNNGRFVRFAPGITFGGPSREEVHP